MIKNLQDAINYLEKGVRSFDDDPPDSDFQRGYLRALKTLLENISYVPSPTFH